MRFECPDLGCRSAASPLTIYRLILVLAALSASGALAGQREGHSLNAARRVALNGLHPGFEQNLGQSDARVRYLSRAGGYTLFLTPASAVAILPQPESQAAADEHPTQHPVRRRQQAASVAIGFVGANPALSTSGLDPLPGRANYFIGKDPNRWHADVPSYARIKYTGIYPGIDLIFYDNRGTLECDFNVAAGANPAAIKLSLEGGRAKIENSGDVSIITASGAKLTLKRPAIYQRDARGARHKVSGSYVLSSGAHKGATVAVALGSYDRSRLLTIDPQLVYSTYLGGSFPSQANGIAVDSNGLVYVTGDTTSADFPISANVFQPTAPQVQTNAPIPNLAMQTVFVTMLNPSASGSAQLVYSSFLGGSAGDGQQANSIAVDAKGVIYLTGNADVRDFPVTSGAFQSSGPGRAFVSVLNPNESGSAQLVYSTYLGGCCGDSGNSVAVDSSGLAYVAGNTNSDDFPVTSNAVQLAQKSTNVGTGFVTVLDPSQSGVNSIVYSSFLGGSTFDNITGLALGPSNNVYVTGWTSSKDFPVHNAFQPTLRNFANCFVTVLDLAKGGSQELVYSTFLGGSLPNFAEDQCNASAVDSKGIAFVAGGAASTNFPTTATAFQKADKANGATTAFLSEIDPSKSGSGSLVYSTYLGGSNGEHANALAVLDSVVDCCPTCMCAPINSAGLAYVTGDTFSSDFPTTKGAYQTLAEGGLFLSVINPSAKSGTLAYSTFVGVTQGSSDARAIAVNSSSGFGYIAGQTTSNNFPVTADAFQAASKQTRGSEGDAFVSVIDPAQALHPAAASLKANPAIGTFPDQFFGGVAAAGTAQTLTLAYSASSTHQYSAIAIEGIQAQDADTSVRPEFSIVKSTTTCTIGASLTPGNTCAVSVLFAPGKSGMRKGTLEIASNASNAPLKITLQGKAVTGPLQISPSQLDFGSVQIGVRNETPQFVTITNNNPGPVVLNGAHLPLGFKLANPTNNGGCTTDPKVGRGIIPANGSCQIGLLFFPGKTGKVTGTASFVDEASNSPQAVKLAGTGLPAPPSPTPIPRPTPIQRW